MKRSRLSRRRTKPEMLRLKPVTASFGSIKWQDEMAYNVATKLAYGVKLTDAEKAFVKVQLDRNR